MSDTSAHRAVECKSSEKCSPLRFLDAAGGSGMGGTSECFWQQVTGVSIPL